ncbi:MAG: CBS domain-containing protein [Candidatus Lokiarchaeota archaeon]|nr:CBS domain-containing protein [Candidatus Lokiarchaeota archaeon]MBD3200239.1 CBS domain-containing protein [Candidatus Lokiarchaeota archaeon]
MGLSKNEFYVKDLVIDDEYGTISSDATVKEAANLMKEIGIPDLVVLENNTDKILGVIGDFDIIQNVVAEGSDPSTVKVVDVMYIIEPVTLETPVEDAFGRMRDLQVNVVPVVKNGKLKGVCTIQDCWSYIPDQIVDEVGLIPIRNTKVVEFWFASVAAILALLLGVILPMAGVFAFFDADQSELLTYLGIADLRSGFATFHLFEARGTDFFIPLTDIILKQGGVWVLILINSFLVLIFGIIGMFSIIYNSFIDIRYAATGKLIRYIIPSLFIVFLIFQWILYSIVLATAVPSISYIIDGLGLGMSILSLVLMLLAILRDYIFRENEFSKKGLSEEI